MSKLVANYNGGASDEYGTFAALNRLLTGDVIEGFQVVPNSTPNMTIKVNPGSGRITTGVYPSSYGYFISHDTTGGESVTIPTAAASPRIDYIVGYIDKGVTAVTSPVNNTNNVLKFADIPGTPAGSPVAPTVSQIQTAIGAANPYIILAQIAVAASATTITTPNITDLRSLASSVIQTLGAPIQSVSAGFSSVATGTTIIPLDDTIPQITEGTEFMTLAITPTSATNVLVVEVLASLAHDGSAENLIGAIFRDTTANAIAANTAVQLTANGSTLVEVEGNAVAGSTSLTTFRFRAGSQVSGTLTFNGRASARVFGAITKSFIKITEYKAS